MNRGAVNTLQALSDRGLSINQGALLVGADSGTFSKILREKDGRKPGRALAAKIFAELGVNPSLWEEEVATDEPPNPDQAGNTERTETTHS